MARIVVTNEQGRRSGIPQEHAAVVCSTILLSTVHNSEETRHGHTCIYPHTSQVHGYRLFRRTYSFWPLWGGAVEYQKLSKSTANKPVVYDDVYMMARLFFSLYYEYSIFFPHVRLVFVFVFFCFCFHSNHKKTHPVPARVDISG